jgi:hypothetical protein
MLKIVCMVLASALLYSQSADLHYHAHHHATDDVAGHELQHSLHPASMIHAVDNPHELVSTVEAVGALALQSSLGQELAFLLLAVLLFAGFIWGRAEAPPLQTSLHPGDAFEHLRPPLRAPPA